MLRNPSTEGEEISPGNVPEIADGVLGVWFDKPDGIYIPFIVSVETEKGNVGRMLDRLPSDRRIVFSVVMSQRLKGMLARRGFVEAELFDKTLKVSYDAMVREPGVKVNVIPVAAVLRLVKESLATVTTDMKEFAADYAGKANQTITCVSGCAHCCYQKILVTAADGLAIYAHLRMTGRWTDEIIGKLVESDRRMTEMDHPMYFVEKIPCAFLAEEKTGWGQCTVYDVRPVSCAATFSSGGNPEYCAVSGDQDGKGQFQVMFHNVASIDNYLRVMQVIEVNIETEGLYLQTLPGAVLWAAAIVEGRPMPKIHRVLMDVPGEASDAFDAVAKHKRPR